ncbi:hypothetical protein BH09PLA1_BH09PLA1_31720 [soil metagenome]
MLTSRASRTFVLGSRPARLHYARFAKLAAVVVALAGIAPPAEAVPTFTSAVQLQTPAGGEGGSAYVWDSVSAGYGAAGDALFSNRPSGAVRWAADGSATVLGDVPGLTTRYGGARGINNAGQTVGGAVFAEVGGRAVRWQADGSAVLLGDVPGETTHGSYGYSINNAGQTAGVVTLLPTPTRQDHRAVRWAADGSATRLGDPAGLGIYDSSGYSINDAGQVAGYANGTGGIAAVRWEANGSATILADPPGPAPRQIIANAINNSGESVGWVDQVGTDFTYSAVRWAADGSATLLGGVPGVPTYYSHAYGITDSGLVAGSADLSVAGIGDNRAVIWDAAGNGALLQNLMADGNSWNFTNALSIDADATTIRVLAYGSKNGGPNGYYMVNAAIPEPTVLGLLGVVAVIVLSGRRVVVVASYPNPANNLVATSINCSRR